MRDYVAEMIGQRFGRLTVIRFAGVVKTRRRYECRCECGNTHVAESSNLKKGNVRSCGCLHRENKPRLTHGGRKSSSYSSWQAMMARCHDPNNPSYWRYGGRGIRVCPEWHDFPAFLKDMGEKPPRTSIDRIDNERGYSPDNCRWATPTQQSRNRGVCKKIEMDGRSQILSEWAEEYGVNYDLVFYRYTHGWPLKEALTAPPGLKRAAALEET